MKARNKIANVDICCNISAVAELIVTVLNESKTFTGVCKYLNTYCGNSPIKSISNDKNPIGTVIDNGASSFLSITCCAFSLLGLPRKIMLNAFVKASIAIVPTNARAAIANNSVSITKKLFTLKHTKVN